MHIEKSLKSAARPPGPGTRRAAADVVAPVGAWYTGECPDELGPGPNRVRVSQRKRSIAGARCLAG